MSIKKPISIGAPQPWPPPPPPLSPPPPPSSDDNKSYNNCIQGICSATCPQMCSYLFFPPPPPFPFPESDDDSDSSSSRISPLMAALIAVLAAAFLLLLYYTVISRYCRRNRRNSSSPSLRLDPLVQDPARPVGLDDTFIHQITVFKYRKDDKLIDGSDCAVCLSEFKEEESLRLMPNCEHAFHIPCIDTWLRTHSSCPLCRAGMNPDPPARPGGGGSVGVAAMRVERRSNDAVLVIREEEGEVIVCHHDVAEREDHGDEEVVVERDDGELGRKQHRR